MYENHSETTGERSIKAELTKLGLKFIQEKAILGLKGDTKHYRVADFYLPDYDVYIEFFGNWNTNEEHKKRYRHKRIVYQKNNIDCIYIYPKSLYKSAFIIDSYIKKKINGKKTLTPKVKKVKATSREYVQKNELKIDKLIVGILIAFFGLIFVVIPEPTTTLLGIIIAVIGILKIARSVSN